MSLVDVVAVMLFSGVVLYACLGGADFGVGIWDLTAGGARRGAKLRSLIDHSIGPVWEANHVWLIFVLVYLWSAFPTVFAAICQTLWVPLSLAALGIVLRGAGFAFRKVSSTMRVARAYGVIFATSSVVTPFFFGTIAGAVVSGRVPLDGAGDTWNSWTGPSSLIGGVVAVITCAFLAAVFLTHDAKRTGDAELFNSCRNRAIGTAGVAGVVVFACLLPLRSDAPLLFHGLTHRAAPVLGVSFVAGVATLILLLRRHTFAARFTAFAAVAAVVLGWGVAQYPYALLPDASLANTAGARATLIALTVVYGFALVTVVPALAALYWLFQQPLDHSRNTPETTNSAQ